MVIAHIVVLSAALLTLLFLPCLVKVLVGADRRAMRRGWHSRSPEEIRELRVVDAALRDERVFVMASPARPPFRQVADDLRRLGQQRVNGLCRESVVWQAAVLRAYDTRLTLACQYLGVVEHLEPLDGLDRDLERLRVESRLAAAGLELD